MPSTPSGGGCEGQQAIVVDMVVVHACEISGLNHFDHGPARAFRHLHEDAALVRRLRVLRHAKIQARSLHLRDDLMDRQGVNQNEGSTLDLANESPSLPTSTLAALAMAGFPIDVPVAFYE